MAVPAIAADPAARQIGERLFLNTCAQCHGSDARGGRSFPNLTDADWLYGGTPEAIEQTITHGRHGIVPPWKASIDPAAASDTAHYVRRSEERRVGKEGVSTCRSRWSPYH